jgi:hypothetical protein
LAVTITVALFLGACFKGKPADETDPVAVDPAPNGAPTISGSPPSSVRVGETYSFVPSASDPDGDRLTFSIANRPSWAQFDTSTGRLSGTVGQSDVGIAANVQITASDGKAQASLASFSISVNQVALGSATLSWLPPTENSDGTALTDLAGYRIYYGRSSSALDQVVAINNPGLTSYLVDNLSPARWYFSMTTLNSHGLESERSATASKTIS